MTLYNQKLANEAKEWLIECFPDLEVLIDEASPQLHLKWVEQEYEGGIAQFIKDGQ